MGLPAASTSDDDTVVTPPRGDRTRSTDRELEEKTIKFRFAPVTDGNPVPPHILHVHWMHAVQKAFGSQVQFFDNANRLVPVIDPLRTEETSQKMRFTLHGRTEAKRMQSRQPVVNGHRRTTKYIVHRVRTAYPINELKAAPEVMKMLKDHDFYVNEHRWSEEDWDVLQIGFMFGIDPTFYTIDQATAKIMDTIARNMPARTKVPKFKLVYSTPKVVSSRREIRTKAYAIETHRSTALEMAKLLKEVCKTPVP